MEGKDGTSAIHLRSRYDTKTRSLSRPSAKPVTISAAAVFNKRKFDTSELQSSPRRPQKSTVKKTAKTKREGGGQPLALAFKETSEGYRRHLYSTAVTKINKDLDMLLHKLYDSNLEVSSSDVANGGARASPLKLTVPAKYQRVAQKLYKPLSRYRYSLQHTNASGELERVQTNLHNRFQLFEERLRAETQQIKELQRQWEGVVAEIFQLGTACLGEDQVAALLATTDERAVSPASKAESTLFFPEHSSSAKTGKGKRKRVSFAGPDMLDLFPGFLSATVEHEKKPVPATPELSSEELQQFRGEVAGLGNHHIKDMQRLDKEHRVWWEKKQTQLAHTFLQD